MNGIINVLKPPGMTSFDVVAYLRRILNTKKIGHAGTLDPAAAGVLPICAGNATKSIEYIMDMEKTYRAELTLGVSTDTQDSFGQIIESHKIDVSADRIAKIINCFVGEIEQVPPMFSALRVGGKRLYEMAREGKVIERKPRKIFINSINIINIKDNKVLVDIICSKGTYIRTLCSDIGDALGCGGHMSFLIRKKTGIFEIDSSYTLEDITEAVEYDKIYDILRPTDKVFKSFDDIFLNSDDGKRFRNGNYIDLNNQVIDNASSFKYDCNVDIICNIGTILKVYDDKKHFIGLGEIINIDGRCFIKPKKMFN